MATEEDRKRAIALFAAAHEFPLQYPVSVIIMNVDTVLIAVLAVIEDWHQAPLPADDYEAVPSRGGRYSTYRFKVPCATPEDALSLHERLRAIDGVITVL